MDGEKLAAEHAATAPLYTTGDNLWGIPYKVDVKSTVWYPIKAFEAAGYEVPTTWDELIALSDQIVADGGIPWCIGMEAGRATGWIIDRLDRGHHPAHRGQGVYDKWISHELPFNSPEVKSAFDLAGQMFFTPGYVDGGGTGILATSQPRRHGPDVQRGPDEPRLLDAEAGRLVRARLHSRMSRPRRRSHPSTSSARTSASSTSRRSTRRWATRSSAPAMRFMVTQDRPEVRAVAQFLSTPAGHRGLGQARAARSRRTRPRRPSGTRATTSRRSRRSIWPTRRPSAFDASAT